MHPETPSLLFSSFAVLKPNAIDSLESMELGIIWEGREKDRREGKRKGGREGAQRRK